MEDLTQLGLAHLLKGYGIKPKTIHLVGTDQLKAKGYLLESFARAFRYIPEAREGENTRNSVTTAENGQKRRNLADSEVTAKTAGNGQSYGVTPVPGEAPSFTDIDPFESLKDPSLRLQEGGGEAARGCR